MAVDRRILLGGLALGAFAVTLALTAGREVRAPSAEDVATNPAPAPHQDSNLPTGPAVLAPRTALPETPTEAPPPTAATPPAVIAPLDTSPSESEYEQNVNPGVDIEAMRRDRGVQHAPEPH